MPWLLRDRLKPFPFFYTSKKYLPDGQGKRSMPSDHVRFMNSHNAQERYIFFYFPRSDQFLIPAYYYYRLRCAVWFVPHFTRSHCAFDRRVVLVWGSFVWRCWPEAVRFCILLLSAIENQHRMNKDHPYGRISATSCFGKGRAYG